jgi:diketogulonate reductase-like aldo/keto reductase
METARAVPTTKFPFGEKVPVLGQGTWRLAEGRHSRSQEIEALRLGIDLGMSLIDTAEMYADGAAEILLGDAIAGCRDDVFLVTKVLPENATRRGTIEACERSLRRLKTDRIDLYLLHWREDIPLQQTVEAFQKLVKEDKITHWGVSNFDVNDMNDLMKVDGGSEVFANQVLYNLTRRGIEFDLMPWCHKRNIPIMAYSPIEQGRLLSHPIVRKIAEEHHAAPAQVALAWVLRNDHVIAIPQAGTPDHVRENHGAIGVKLSKRDLAKLDRAFPPPRSKEPLAVL